MAKQVRLLEAQHRKIRIYGALTGGERYICAERLMAAAAPGIGKEDKRSLVKKLSELSAEYGGAFRAKVSGADRWFVTRQLVAECLAREIAAYRNGTYARFADNIRGRVKVLMDMITLSGRLCKRGFHRTDGTLVPDIDRTSGKTASAVDIDTEANEAARLLAEHAAASAPVPADGGALGGDPSIDEIMAQMGDPEAGPDTGKAEQSVGGNAADTEDGAEDAGPAGPGPGDIIRSLTSRPKLSGDTLAKMRDRMCALSVLAGTSLAYKNLDDTFLATVYEIQAHPYHSVRYKDWLALFGVTPEGEWLPDTDPGKVSDRDVKMAESCAGVWDMSPEGPERSMSMNELLENCMLRP